MTIEAVPRRRSAMRSTDDLGKMRPCHDPWGVSPCYSGRNTVLSGKHYPGVQGTPYPEVTPPGAEVNGNGPAVFARYEDVTAVLLFSQGSTVPECYPRVPHEGRGAISQAGLAGRDAKFRDLAPSTGGDPAPNTDHLGKNSDPSGKSEELETKNVARTLQRFGSIVMSPGSDADPSGKRGALPPEGGPPAPGASSTNILQTTALFAPYCRQRVDRGSGGLIVTSSGSNNDPPGSDADPSGK